MTDEIAKVKRPPSITIISLYTIFMGVVILSSLTLRGIQFFGILVVAFMALVGVALLVCGTGLWLMKKWAVGVQAVLIVVSQIIMYFVGTRSILLISLVLSAIVLFVGYNNLSKMSRI